MSRLRIFLFFLIVAYVAGAAVVVLTDIPVIAISVAVWLVVIVAAVVLASGGKGANHEF